MNHNNKNVPPLPRQNLKGSHLDSKGLPLRMNFDQRTLDNPYGRSKSLKFTWDRFEGVTITPVDKQV